MAIIQQYAVTEDTHNTSSYVQIDSMTYTPASGHWLAIFVGSIEGASGATMNVAFHIDSTIQQHTEREQYQEGSMAGQRCMFIIPFYCNPNGSQAINVRWKTSTGSVSILERRLIFHRLSEAATQGTATDSPTINSATPTLLGSMQAASPGVSTYLALFSASMTAGAVTETVHFAVYNAGVEIAHSERRVYCEGSLTGSTYFPVFVACKVAVTGASDDVEIRWWRTGASAATCLERTFTLIDCGASNIEEVSATASDTSTSTTDELMDSMQTSSITGEYTAMWSGVRSFGSLGTIQNTIYSFYEDTVEVSNTELQIETDDSLDSMDINDGNCAAVNPSSETVRVYWRNNNSDTRTIEERTLVCLADYASTEYELEGYRWRQDNGSESAADWLQSQDIDITRAVSTNTRLRILTDTSSADPPSEGVQLEYKRTVDGSAEWRKVPLT